MGPSPGLHTWCSLSVYKYETQRCQKHRSMKTRASGVCLLSSGHPLSFQDTSLRQASGCHFQILEPQNLPWVPSSSARSWHSDAEDT